MEKYYMIHLEGGAYEAVVNFDDEMARKFRRTFDLLPPYTMLIELLTIDNSDIPFVKTDFDNITDAFFSSYRQVMDDNAKFFYVKIEYRNRWGRKNSNWFKMSKEMTAFIYATYMNMRLDEEEFNVEIYDKIPAIDLTNETL